MNERGLTGVALPDLEALLLAVERRRVTCPLTRVGLQAVGLGHLGDELSWLGGLDAGAVSAVLRAVVAERRLRPPPRVDLVWTGPETRTSTARDTAVVVRQLFREARRSVLVGGFRFDHGEAILRPLYEAMTERGVEAQIFLDVESRATTEAEVDVVAAAALEAFYAENWPFGDPCPAICYDPRTALTGTWASLHAKCVVVDERKAFVTSANFTDRGQTRNIEAGVLIEDVELSMQLVRQWRSLIEEGLVRCHEGRVL
jgi:phosphatidylserine/phosphatidylglycerophosphate/cardiolipin synthase-like enzyme